MLYDTKKTILAIALTTSLLSGTLGHAYESDVGLLPDLSGYPTRLLVDGMPADGATPLYADGQVLFPLRAIAEAGDYVVTWDETKRTVVLDGETHDYTVDPAAGTLSEKGETLLQDENMRLEDGTTYVSPELFDHVDGISAAWDGATNTAVVTTATPADNVYVYDLGEGALDNPVRPDTPYRMQGVIGVPEGENCPVVIFLHGSHPVEKAAENRYDLGFTYLVNQLADAGYLAISMNVAINYSFEDGEPSGCDRTVQVVEQQSELLRRAIAGEEGIFPCDLTGKGDLSRVILVGHSRAGADILTVAAETEILDVQGLISVAPSIISPLEGTPVDVPTGIIIPQYDGDVTSLDGGKLFDELESAEGRVSDAELIYLKEGDHSGFSTALVRPDPFSSQEDRDRVMDRSRQQAFLSAYVKDFADQVLEDGHTPFAGQTELPESYGGCEVLIRVDEESQVLFQAGQETKPDLAAEGVQAEWVNASSTVDNTAGAFRLPGGFTTYDLLRLQWEQPEAAVSIPVSADLGEAGMLQLDLTQDSSDPLNHQKDQSVRVILTDADGKEAAVEIPAGTPALSWQEGETETYPGIGETELSQYSTFTPLGTLRIELSAFQGVDLTHITGITLEFPQDSGSVMLREIEAVG